MTLVPLERIATQTLLGIRFWDRLAEQPVASGLVVQAQLLSADGNRRVGRPVIGRVTPSGVIAFFGLTAAERVEAERERQVWETLPAEQAVVVDVRDSRGRYLPISFVARLPFRGAFKGRGSWLSTPLLRPIPPAGEEMGVQLWSAPARPLPPGRGLIRAQIVAGSGDEPAPAAYALVEAALVVSGPPPPLPFRYFGMADENGTLALPLPYPPVPDPDGGTYSPLAQQAFPLAITVYYDEDLQEPLPGSDVPNLETVLNQPAVDVGSHWTGGVGGTLQLVDPLDVTLTFGRPLVLRTAIGSADADEKESVLRIQPT